MHSVLLAHHKLHNRTIRMLPFFVDTFFFSTNHPLPPSLSIEIAAIFIFWLQIRAQTQIHYVLRTTVHRKIRF